MKKLISLSFILLAVVSIYAFMPAPKLDTYKVLPEYSKVDWVGSKKSGSHTGRFTVKSGEVHTENGKLKGGKFVIDLANLKVTDDAGENLEKHLKNKDFFDVASFGEASYEITSVNYTADNACDVNGKLTIKGLTVPVKFQAIVRNADDKRFFGQAFFTLDRSLIGVNYGQGNIANDVQVSVHLFANK